MEYETKPLPLEVVTVDESPAPEDSTALMRYYEVEGSRLLVEARGIAIVDQESRERASEFVLRTREIVKKIRDWREPIIKRAFELHRSLTSERNQLTKPFEDAQRIADAEISRDYMEQKRLEREANERALREAWAAEEKERRRLEELALRQLERGDEAKASATLDKAETVFRPAILQAPTEKTTQANCGATTVRIDIEITIVDMRALAAEVAAGRVPAKVLTISMADAKAYVKAIRDGEKLPHIPGLQITERPRVSGRIT